MTVCITLPWMHSKLSSNSTAHWRVKAPLIKQCRRYGYCAALEAKIPPYVKDKSVVIPITITFHEPDKIRRDKQNLPMSGALKAYIDGIADAMKIDDYQFLPKWENGDIVKGGAVIICVG